MKYIKSSEWVRLRGQVAANNEICKLDTKVEDKPRVFFVPETEVEKTFFDLDTMLGVTFLPYGPVSHDPDGMWGWRFYADRTTEEDMEKFSKSIENYMKTIYENSVNTILNSTAAGKNKKTDPVLN